MSETSAPLSGPTRPPELGPAAALPMDPRDGLLPVAVTGEYAANLAITRGALPRAIAVFALPAVASMLLMTLFYSADAFWVGQKIGAAGLAAVSTSVFWIWMIISGADMVSVGLTAVASRRHGEGRPGDAARAVGDAVVYALVIGVSIAVAGRIICAACSR